MDYYSRKIAVQIELFHEELQDFGIAGTPLCKCVESDSYKE